MAKKPFQDTAVPGLYGIDDSEQHEPQEPESRFGAWFSGFISGVVFTLFGVAIYQVLVTVRVLT